MATSTIDVVTENLKTAAAINLYRIALRRVHEELDKALEKGDINKIESLVNSVKAMLDQIEAALPPGQAKEIVSEAKWLIWYMRLMIWKKRYGLYVLASFGGLLIWKVMGKTPV